MRAFQSRNPFTQQVLKHFDFASDRQAEAVLVRSAAAFQTWSHSSVPERALKLERLGELVNRHKDDLARQITMEMGKPIVEAAVEVWKCVDCCLYYSHQAAELLAPLDFPLIGYNKVQVQFEPLGPLLLVMPFNFPLWMTFKTSVPHLLAGNTVILKPAENTPGCAEALTAIAREAGLGDVFQHALLSVEQVHRTIEHPLLRGVSLTGSVRAGKAVAATAGRCLKKCVLELGGSDPFLVLSDADVGKAAKAAAAARLAVSGQVCIAPKRFIVMDSVATQFTEALLAELRGVEVSDPMEAACKLGPLAREDLVETLAVQLQDAQAQGAQVLLGGSWQGCNFQPTVLTQVTHTMRVMREETFGPLFPICRVSSEAEAIAVANASDYGLGAVVFCQENRADSIARQLEVGMVFINGMVKSLVPVPFGGTKGSGIGRELGVLGIREFTNAKTVAKVT